MRRAPSAAVPRDPCPGRDPQRTPRAAPRWRGRTRCPSAAGPAVLRGLLLSLALRRPPRLHDSLSPREITRDADALVAGRREIAGDLSRAVGVHLEHEPAVEHRARLAREPKRLPRVEQCRARLPGKLRLERLE